jgi:2-polyprenyl-3-methyl-5-hydroxy-6-metoxy-1,4-benzoquinol methylase
MTTWQRTAPFGADHENAWRETWQYCSAKGDVHSFDVEVRSGKRLEVLKLKGIDLGEIRSYADFLAATAERLYRSASDIRHVGECPMCRTSLDDAKIELAVFGVPYLRCPACGHVGVGARPAVEVLDQIFAESETHSSAYVDHNAIEIRMEQIIVPKLEWCIGHFREQRRREPQSVVDVGAGGGHFLAGAQRRGMEVGGFEKSRVSRAFAQEAFGLSLRNDDFLAASDLAPDVITFWGLLEYVARPRDFLAAARRRLGPDGMLVVEVPRVDALGTMVQGMDGAVVARHMDPTTHVNGFTDASICTALVEEGFAPVAAWYFGMDAYETFVQAALKANDPGMFDVLADFIPVLQQALDRGRQCDDIIIAAVPIG